LLCFALEEPLGNRRAPLFHSPADQSEAVGRHLADSWLRAAEKLAQLEHPITRALAPIPGEVGIERKHLLDVDVAPAGGWIKTATLKPAYQQADVTTMLRVVLEGGELREL
jgi:hypothetical protein